MAGGVLCAPGKTVMLTSLTDLTDRVFRSKGGLQELTILNSHRGWRTHLGSAGLVWQDRPTRRAVASGTAHGELRITADKTGPGVAPVAPAPRSARNSRQP